MILKKYNIKRFLNNNYWFTSSTLDPCQSKNSLTRIDLHVPYLTMLSCMETILTWNSGSFAWASVSWVYRPDSGAATRLMCCFSRPLFQAIWWKPPVFSPVQTPVCPQSFSLAVFLPPQHCDKEIACDYNDFWISPPSVAIFTMQVQGECGRL